MTACLKEVIILQLWSGLVTAFDFSGGPPDQYLYVTLHVCLALATNRRKTLFGSTKCVEKLCLTTCAIQYAGLWVRQSRCCGVGDRPGPVSWSSESGDGDTLSQPPTITQPSSALHSVPAQIRAKGEGGDRALPVSHPAVGLFRSGKQHVVEGRSWGTEMSPK